MREVALLSCLKIARGEIIGRASGNPDRGLQLTLFLPGDNRG